MKKYNMSNKGFVVSPVLLILLLTAALFFLVSCGDSSAEDKTALKEVEKSAEEIKDTSMMFSGDVTQATCLECHPGVKEGKSDIDFEKVKDAGMTRGKNMDVQKKDPKETEDIK